MKNDNKAFVCFLVDGPSDIDALQDRFEELFDSIGGDNINVEFRYSEFQKENHGDITTLTGVDADNVDKKIYKYYFKGQDKSSGLGWNELTHIIHIIDTDGAFTKNITSFSEEEIAFADSLCTRPGEKHDTLYFDDHIAVRGVTQSMEDRNSRKRKVIEKLLSRDYIEVGKKQVGYSLYYFSSNLDHFLHGKANYTGHEKMRLASDFADSIQDIDEFCEYFKDHPDATTLTYDESWKQIKKGNNSLARGTNVNLLIDRIINSTLEDWL